MDLDFAGRLLVLNPHEPKIHVFNVEDLSALRTVDLGDHQPAPLAVSVDGRNLVNVLDGKTKSIHRYDSEFREVDVVSLEGCENLEPKTMSSDSYQRLHVVSEHKGSVCVFDTQKGDCKEEQPWRAPGRSSRPPHPTSRVPRRARS